MSLEAGVMSARRAALGGLLGAAGLAALSRRAAAGPLNPPAGPVASTGKTLTEVEPRVALSAANTPGDATAVYVIAQPGTYYLTDHLAVPTGKAGVRIAASDVMLDLSGFRISGGGAAGTRGVVDGGAALNQVGVRNGSVVTMAGMGIDLSATSWARLEDLVLRGNGGCGAATGAQARVIRVIADANAASQGALAAGLRCGNAALIERTLARGNTGAGIAAGANSRFTESVANNNTGTGIDTLEGSVVERCVSAVNGGSGIGGPSVVRSCAVSDNAQRGIGTARAVIEGCTARANGNVGISVGGGSAVSECSAPLQTSAANSSHGYDLGPSSVLEMSTAYSNAGVGIFALQNARIASCVARRNTTDGISTSLGKCLIVNNTCSDNGTAALGAGSGVRAAGAGSRIEGNLCTGNSAWGVSVVSSGNMIVKNACSANTINWSLFTNCIAGTVVDRTAISVSGMSGNGTVASTMGTTDPFANFSY